MPNSTYAFTNARPAVHAHPPPLPVYPPLESAYPNPLPAVPQPAKPFADPRFAVSTHVVPAAYLRCMPLPTKPLPPAPNSTSSKEDRRAAVAERMKWVSEQTVAERGRHERVLFHVVNRYVAVEPRSEGKTLFLAHANGFPKETWEPAILDLLSKENAVDQVDEIWAWEATHHGASSIFNAQIGAELTAYDWSDNGRDVLNFLLHFLPSEIAPPNELPTLLPRVPATESALRRVRGYNDRKLFAAGHSFGGFCCAYAAIYESRLFTGLMLVDPVVICSADPPEPPGEKRPSLAEGALARRDLWPSRQVALESFKSSPFFGSWDPRVLDAYVEYGLVPSSDGKNVQLAMPPIQESLAFSATYTSGIVWDLLRTLDPRVPIRWVVPGKPGEPEIGKPGSTQERVWLRPQNSSNIRLGSAGHLATQQVPGDVAKELAGLLHGHVPTSKL
ncbi:AB hydrolase-1 domain-containing protein [Mycena chlorophos]|uniref:AB hydrolase-1 domain-containing protein n=1 Tax=Mycena chlorophos TaxID=658473 RepID=A0A8H6TSE4_MYCCL|nr:AB hydrolase-1 domain-containing protein [Mycena chlorophos]